jgi:hypothetical protein
MNKIIKYLMLIVAILFSSTGIHAATVSVSSTSLVVNESQVFTLDLIGANFNSGTLDGGGINVNFDPTIINVNRVLINTDEWEFYSAEGSIDNVSGAVNGIEFNSFEIRTGNLNFATIEFIAVGAGYSALGLTEYGFNPFASGGSVYSNLSFDESISIIVQSVPLPTAIWLFISGFVLLVTRHRSKLA